MYIPVCMLRIHNMCMHIHTVYIRTNERTNKRMNFIKSGNQVQFKEHAHK